MMTETTKERLAEVTEQRNKALETLEWVNNYGLDFVASVFRHRGDSARLFVESRAAKAYGWGMMQKIQVMRHDAENPRAMDESVMTDKLVNP